jgi:hypothetical protein
MREVDIEGYTANEILNLPNEQLDAFVLSGRPIVFRAGSAEILGEFKIKGESWSLNLRKSMAVVKAYFRRSPHWRGGMRRNAA